MAKFQVVGQPVARVDSVEKVTGEAQYVADLKLPGMLYAKVLRSPYAHAKILRIETRHAAALPGVRAVITAEDTPKLKGGGIFIQDMPPLAIDRVRYIGEEVAAVAADSEAIAEAALARIEVEYEPLPAVFDPFEAMNADAPKVQEERPDNVAWRVKVDRGDVDAGFAAADAIVEAEFSTQTQYHAYMEPIGTVAYWSTSNKLTVYSSIQSIFMERDKLSHVLGLSENDIRVIQTVVGGGFGGKCGDENNMYIAALLSRKSRKPVRLINTREEEFMASRPRVPTNLHVKLGFTGEGRITAKDSHIVNDNGAYTVLAAPMLGVTARRVDHQYRMQNVRADAKLVYTNRIPTSAMRGFGNPEAHFAHEVLMDMAAAKLGIDPMDLHLINASERGDVTVHGSVLLSCELKQCIEKVRIASDWDRRRREKIPGRGIGMATYVHVSGKRHFENWDGANVIVKIDPSGRVVVLTGEGELGQGGRTIFAQICAEELGVPYESVSVATADTEYVPYCDGTHASRATYVGGNGVRIAAADAKRQLLETASELLGLPAEELTIAGGVISSTRVPSQQISVLDTVHRRIYRSGGSVVMGVGSFDAPSTMEDASRYGNESGAYSFGAHVAEVAVDLETGAVRVLNYWTCDDAGTVINPLLAGGQTAGGVIQGLGYALTEWIQNEEGQVINPNFTDYKMPTIQQIPNLFPSFAESYEPTGPFGAKGMSEGVLIPVAPAIANAVFDATGFRCCSLPISAEKLWKGIQALKK